jgi:hypothetical protein
MVGMIWNAIEAVLRDLSLPSTDWSLTMLAFGMILFYGMIACCTMEEDGFHNECIICWFMVLLVYVGLLAILGLFGVGSILFLVGGTIMMMREGGNIWLLRDTSDFEPPKRPSETPWPYGEYDWRDVPKLHEVKMDSETWPSIVESFIMQGELLGAHVALIAAIDQNPQDVKAWLKLVEVLRMREFTDAKAAAEEGADIARTGEPIPKWIWDAILKIK